VPANLDGLRLGAKPEADRDDMRGAAATDRGEPTEPLPAQVFDLFLGERAHNDLLNG